MKTISKIAVLAMTLALAGALTACGSSSSSSAAASSSAASTSASAASTQASTSSASASAASTSAQASSAAATSSTAATNAAASSGAAATSQTASAVGEAAEAPDVYENDFFGIAFNLPEGWSFVETSAIDNVNEKLAGIAQGSLDMVAQSADNSVAVMVTVEEASANNAGQTAETHLEAITDETLSSMEGSSFSYVSDSATLDFEGVNRSIPATITKMTNDGQEMCLGQACAEVDGNFFVITIIGASEDAVNQAFSYFSGASN